MADEPTATLHQPTTTDDLRVDTAARRPARGSGPAADASVGVGGGNVGAVAIPPAEQLVDPTRDTYPDGRSPLAYWFSPLVAVMASQDADETAIRNNIPTFSFLLNALGSRAQAPVTLRPSGPGEQTHVVNDLALRFTFPDSAIQPLFHPDIVEKVADARVRDMGQQFRTKPALEELDELLTHPNPNQDNKQDRSQLVHATINPTLLKRHLERTGTPWYTKYSSIICENIGVSAHETFNHPVAYLFVVTTANINPVGELTNLATDTQGLELPHSQSHFLDPTIPKFYLLIHDVLSSGKDPEPIFNAIKSNFPAEHCFFFQIDTANHPGQTTIEDLWHEELLDYHQLSQYQMHQKQTPASSKSFQVLTPQPTESDHKGMNNPTGDDSMLSISTLVLPSLPTFGENISVSDIKGISEFIIALRAMVIRSMEDRAQMWNEQVASSRRGIAGRLYKVGLKYFGSSSKNTQAQQTAYTDANGVLIFPHDAPEMIMRRLGDYYFMLRDYKNAFSVYESVKKDFQSSSKFAKFLAGVQEMMGYCMVISDGFGKSSIASYMENSVMSYEAIDCSSYSARVTFMYYEFFKKKSMRKIATTCLKQCLTTTKTLRDALLSEQVAISYLLCPQPMYRKHAFMLVLAGYRFAKCGQRNHAYRCYSAALGLYVDKTWNAINDHLNFTLGRYSYHLGDIESALVYFLKLLKRSPQPNSQQETYVKEFLVLYIQYRNSKNKNAEYSKKLAELLRTLPIPILISDSVVLTLTGANFPTVLQLSTANGELQSGNDTNDKALSRPHHSTAKVGTISARDKKALDIVHSYTLKARPNTAEILSKSRFSESSTFSCMSNVSFFISFELENPMNVDISVTNICLICKYQGSEVAPTDTELTSETISSVSLESLSKLLLTIRVTPRVRGLLLISGITAMLNGSVPTTIDFNYTKGGLQLVGSPVVVDVMEPCAILEVDLRNFPSTILCGEFRKVMVGIKNVGPVGLKDLVVATSHPENVHISDDELCEPVSSILSQTGEMFKVDGHLSSIPYYRIKLPNGSLLANQSLEFALWIRSDKEGETQFMAEFSYCSVTSSDVPPKISTLQFSKMVETKYLMRASMFCRPSSRIDNDGEYLLGLEVENLLPYEGLFIQSLTCLSPYWCIKPILEEVAERMFGDLPSYRSRYMYARLYRLPTVEVNELEFSTKIEKQIEFVNKVLLVKGADPNDIQRMPITDWSIGVSESKVVSSQHRSLHPSTPFREFALKNRRQWRCLSLSSKYKTLTDEQRKSLFSLYLPTDVDLAVGWRAVGIDGNANSVAQGSLFIFGVQPHSSTQ